MDDIFLLTNVIFDNFFEFIFSNNFCKEYDLFNDFSLLELLLFEILKVEIQAGQINIFVVTVHLFQKFGIVLNNRFEYLYLGFFDVFLKRFHVEVVEVGKVEVESAHILNRLTQVIILQTAVENYVVAELRDLCG